MTELTPDDLKKANSFIAKIKETFKKLINSIRIPRIVDATIKYPDDIKSAIKEAPAAEGNWIRLGLEKYWMYILPIGIILAIIFAKDALINLINIGSYAVALIPLALIGWYLWKQIK